MNHFGSSESEPNEYPMFDKLGDAELARLLSLGGDLLSGPPPPHFQAQVQAQAHANSSLANSGDVQIGGMSSHLFGDGSSLFGSNNHNIHSLGSDHNSNSNFLSLMSPYINMGSFGEDSEQLLLTPIISPAMTPSVDFANLNLHNGSFSPLSSPALRPSTQAELAAGSSTNPGIKRTSRRTSTHILPSGAGSSSAPERKKKGVPRSPYTIPRQGPSGGIDPLRISSPILKPIAPARRASSSLSPEANDSPGTETSSNGTSSNPGPSSTSSKSKDALFKVPHLPASRMDANTNPNSKTGRPSPDFMSVEPKPEVIDSDAQQSLSASSSSAGNVNAVTPGMLLYLSDEQKESAPMELSSPSSSSTTGSINGRRKGKERELKPLLPVVHSTDGKDAVKKLTHNSNYKNIMEGESGLIGFDATEMSIDMESKKEHHKVSEQKRRDSMKQNFDGLKSVLPQFTDKNPSKEKVLQFSREYIKELRNRVDEADRIMQRKRRGKKTGANDSTTES
ncbi:hypothetical protein BCR33DRAFT_780634 [Rhizoclosmatium globosum]|uniref:BHLH domain-containing protein n=1 Tax=Rhizoclosmatium globosum TaxID=329046 RepID=A0A1Y2CUF8_9FUNG|nr:hypothetical protein BCR33DRAFT_780634 [Rhizoclosmatium globosum]|eukprot:ORY50700.1 hypothetical protein BCR33DRAFT_780634 [Rhizoclosmatium globosum]